MRFLRSLRKRLIEAHQAGKGYRTIAALSSPTIESQTDGVNGEKLKIIVTLPRSAWSKKKKKISAAARWIIAWQVTKKPKKVVSKVFTKFQAKVKIEWFYFLPILSLNNRLALMLDTKLPIIMGTSKWSRNKSMYFICLNNLCILLCVLYRNVSHWMEDLV